MYVLDRKYINVLNSPLATFFGSRRRKLIYERKVTYMRKQKGVIIESNTQNIYTMFIAYVAAKKYQSKWRAAPAIFANRQLFFAFPIFLLGKIGCSKVSVPNDSQKNMQTFYAFSLLSVFQKKIFSVSIDVEDVLFCSFLNPYSHMIFELFVTLFTFLVLL